METSPNVSKHGKGVNQSECPIPGEAGLVDAFCNNDPNANWGTEPNFNLNLNLTSSSNPRPPIETSKVHGGTKKDEGNKGGGKSGVKVAVNTETGKWSSTVKTSLMSPGEKDDPSRQKSKIPALSRSPTAEKSVNSRGEQKLKSPNPKHTPTLSPKTHAHNNMAGSPKPHQQEQTTIASSPTTAERLKTHRAESVLNPKQHIAQTNEMTTKSLNKVTRQRIQSNRKEDGGRESSLKTQSPQTLHVPVNPNIHSQKRDTNITSPKPANRTPTLAGKTHKLDPANTSVKSNEQVSRDSRAHNSETSSVGPKLQNQRAEAALLSTKTPQQSSLSPKPSTQRKVTGTRNSNTSDSKENLDNKVSSAGSASKTSSKSSSSSKAMTVTRDSLDSQCETHSKASPYSKTTTGSGDSLDSKSGSASKITWVSKDSLDSKTGTNSKASSDSKSGMGSKNDPKTQTPSASFNLKCSPSNEPGSEYNFSSSSDVLSSSKPSPAQMTSKHALVGSGFNIDHVASVLPSSSGCNDNNLTSSIAKSSPEPRAEPDSFKSGPVWSSSKSALAHLSSSLALSPTPSSASRSPGPGKSLGSVPSGPSREALRSPGSAPGNYVHAV